jgi:hypothetical protein
MIGARCYPQLPAAEQIRIECLILKVLAAGHPAMAEELGKYCAVPPRLFGQLVRLAELGVDGL